ALTGQNKLRLVTIWKSKGDITTPSTPSSGGYDLDRTLSGGYDTPNPTTQELKSQALELHTTAKEQEEGFKELLEGLKGGGSTLEASSILKSVGSIESKIKRKRGDIGAINDLLRGALITPTKDALDSQLVRIADVLESKGITPTIELQHRNTGYKGLHVQFTYEGIPSEIQVHTAQSWGVKKKLDESYHVLREQEIAPTLTHKEMEALAEESQRLAQDVDLDINALTSFAVSLDKNATSEKSVLVRKSSTDLNDSQNSRLKSYSKDTSSEADTAYSRLDSPLNQNVNLSTGKGNIQTPLNESSTSPLKITPNPAFGEHFKEFELKGAQAVAKLLEEQRGQVAGAFYREDLGYIDLVWGNLKGEGRGAKGWGLSKIFAKHLEDFKGFEGSTPLQKLARGLDHLVRNGELKEVQGVKTIHFTNKNGAFKIGLSRGWDHQGGNHWVITA
ncbi:putative barnase/colicin E5 family endoribonuclease, partial [Helicobacter baculiformis]